MHIVKYFLGALLCLSYISNIQAVTDNRTPSDMPICDEISSILSGMKDNFSNMKGVLLPATTNFWYSKMTLSNTRSNYIYTQYNYKGEPLYHEYYAVIAESGNTEENNAAIEKMGQLIEPCILSGFTKKAAGGLGQFSDDPEFEKSLPKSYAWANATDNTEIQIKSYYETVSKKYRIAVIFKTPNRASNPILKSTPGTTPSKLTVINHLTTAVAGYWVDFEGKEVYYFQLQPNEQITTDTYIGHIWRIKSIPDNSILKTVWMENSSNTLDLK